MPKTKASKPARRRPTRAERTAEIIRKAPREVTALTRDQLHQLLTYARHVEDGRLAAVCMRALDGDSMYHSSIMERCAAAYAGAHMSDEFKLANRVKQEAVIARPDGTIDGVFDAHHVAVAFGVTLRKTRKARKP
jgi:hypothetical protein